MNRPVMNRTTIAACSALALFIWVSASVSGEHLTYKGSDGTTGETTVSRTETGYSIVSKAGAWDHEITTDSSFSTLQWMYHDAAEGTAITATRSGDTIVVDGMFKGKKIQATDRIDRDPWYQDWGIGLKSFVLGNDTTFSFWSINPNDVKQMGKFDAKKEGDESLVVNDAATETKRVRVALQGFLSLFFSADYWFRRSDGVLVQSRTPGASGKPSLMLELVAREP